MTTTTEPTATDALAMLEAAEEYTTHLWRLVREAIHAEPARYAGCTTFDDLHDVCDANEFLIEVDELLGHEYDPTEPDGFDVYCARANTACDIVTALMIVCRRADADARLAFSPTSGTVLFEELPR